VIIPEFTFISCARAVTLAGLIPVSIDCGDDLLLDCSILEKTDMTDVVAVMAVHVYGRRCDMDRIHALASQHKLAVIEDCSEAHGIKLHPKTDAFCWSFYANKVIAGEEGGMISFRRPESAAHARLLRSNGTYSSGEYQHHPRGMNYRLSNTNAELILESLNRFVRESELRAVVAGWYDIFVPLEWHMPTREVNWVYDVLLPETVDMYDVCNQLRKAGLDCRPGFKPISQQAEYLGDYLGLNAYRLSNRIMALPIHPRMDMPYVHNTVEMLRRSVHSPLA
jgi:dTDP-4-amino-4,6-dideoxygalactose transaminase